jgi:hypothetical protein
MTPRKAARTMPTVRDKIFWSLIAALALGQLIAFWMICISQVRRAETREATVQVERVAVSDCMRYIPGATPQKCAARLAAEQNLLLANQEPTPPRHAVARSTLGAAIPADLVLR